jgi:hypothetical protein
MRTHSFIVNFRANSVDHIYGWLSVRLNDADFALVELMAAPPSSDEADYLVITTDAAWRRHFLKAGGGWRMARTRPRRTSKRAAAKAPGAALGADPSA